jgi:hypothetical protein
VGPTDKKHPAGTVELVEPGLMLGYLISRANDRIDTENWKKVCQQALALRQPAGQEPQLRARG